MQRCRLAFLTGELLVSLTVLIPVMLVLIGVFPFAYGMDHKAANFSEAQEVGKDQLEILRARAFDDVTSYSSTQTRGNLELKVQVTVTPWPAGQPVVRQKRVDLRVFWRADKMLLTTYLYKWAR